MYILYGRDILSKLVIFLIEKLNLIDLLHEEITGEVIGAFYEVYNTLCYGFLERVYENAMMFELQERGLFAVKQQNVEVFYKGNIVGDYFTDILVEGKVLIELKAVAQVLEKHEMQLQNYLKATDIEVGLLLNFGDEPKIMRKIFHNHLK